MGKKNGFNKFANVAMIAGGAVVLISILAFLFISGDTWWQQYLIETRSEIGGAGFSILIVGVIAKLFGIKLG